VPHSLDVWADGGRLVQRDAVLRRGYGENWYGWGPGARHVEHIRQSRPDSGPGFKVKVFASGVWGQAYGAPPPPADALEGILVLYVSSSVLALVLDQPPLSQKGDCTLFWGALVGTASEGRGNNSKVFKDLYLQAKARIWP